MWYDTIINVVLMSPFHQLFSKNMMMVSVTGRKSRQVYTLPVNYLQIDDTLYIISYRDRSWWRNLRGGAPLTINLRGKIIGAYGTVLEETTEIADALKTYLEHRPSITLPVGFKVNSEGEIKGRMIAKLVVIKIKLMSEHDNVEQAA